MFPPKLVTRHHAEEAGVHVNPHRDAGEAGYHRRPCHHGLSRQIRHLSQGSARAAADAENAEQPKLKTLFPPGSEKAVKSLTTYPTQVAAEAEASSPVMTSTSGKLMMNSVLMGTILQLDILSMIITPNYSAT